MNFEILQEYASHFNLLVVEDDDIARQEVVAILSDFFKSTDEAADGETGLKLYKERHHDLVITDIRMPKMDGIEMATRIKHLNEEQQVLVVSAHNESEYFIKLINIGVDGFLLKPFNEKRFMYTIYKACRFLYQKKLAHEYKVKMEQANETLYQKNQELANKNQLVRKMNEVMAVKIKENAKISHASQKDAQAKQPTEVAVTVEPAGQPSENTNSEEKIRRTMELEYDSRDIMGVFVDEDLQTLLELEETLGSITDTIMMRHGLSIAEVHALSQPLYQYGYILEKYNVFESVGSSIVSFASRLEGLEGTDESVTNTIFTYIDSFLTLLMQWRKDVFEGRECDPYIYMDSMINDINTIVVALDQNSGNQQEDSEEDSGEITFF